VHTPMPNFTPEQQEVFGHLCFEPGQTLDELAQHSGLARDAVERVVRELGPRVQDRAGDGHYAPCFGPPGWPFSPPRWVEELQLAAGRKRFPR